MALNAYQKIIFSSALTVFAVLMYEELFHLSMELFYVAFDSVEYVLDLVVEHFFETNTHKTQAIVFYIIFPGIVFGLYQLYRFLLRRYILLKHTLHQQKITALAQWHAVPLLKKIACWLFLIAILSCGLFFSLM